MDENGRAHVPEIVERLSRARAAVAGVRRSARNPHGGYEYASVDDVYSAVRAAMSEHGLDLHVDFEAADVQRVEGKGKATNWVRIDAALWLSCPEGAERPVRRLLMAPWTGPQTAEAVVSYLAKSFLRQRLMIPTGEFDDEWGREDPPSARAPAPKPAAARGRESKAAAKPKPAEKAAEKPVVAKWSELFGMTFDPPAPSGDGELPREWAAPCFRELRRFLGTLGGEEAGRWLVLPRVREVFNRLPREGRDALADEAMAMAKATDKPAEPALFEPRDDA